MKNRRWLTVAAAVILIGGGIWHASQHQPTGPAEGTAIQGVEFVHDPPNGNTPVSRENSRTSGPDAFPPIRVGTFNIHGCKGLDNVVDVPRTANCLENLDFVALEEVHGPGVFGGDDQSALLGKQLKMAWLFAPAVRQWYCLESGNSFLTALPATFWQRIPLQSHRDYSFRNVVLAGIKQEGRAGNERIINILVTHVNRRYDEDREAQLRAVIALFLSLRAPAILLGDLNSERKAPQIAQLLRETEVVDPVGKILGKCDDTARIDWIFCRGLDCRDAGILKNEASDHPLVWAELR
jgi:endonuclease/exonuclease/phosphatase family metal-dependent hydrolase